MRKLFSGKALFALIVLFSLLPTAASQAQEQKAAASQQLQKLRVLFIGNSYTYYNNLPQLLAGLAASARPARVLEPEMLTVGGATLKRLWDDGV